MAHLQNNNFTSILAGQHLNDLNMAYNPSISGTIPDVIADMLSLDSLSLNHANLSGTIPPALLGLASLKTLSLANNRLTGPIPPTIAKVVSLAALDLSNNFLVSAQCSSIAIFQELGLCVHSTPRSD